MAKFAKRKPTIHLTERSLRDILEIAAYSGNHIGKRVADHYIEKLEAAIN